MVFECVIVEFDTWVFLMLSKLRLIFLFIVDITIYPINIQMSDIEDKKQLPEVIKRN